MITGEYSVPSYWYDGVYQDKVAPCDAGRSFSLKHSQKSDNAVLCIHGYTGYPGEVVRPAVDLYNAGCDVFAPRLPGHATSGKDFEKSRNEDWIHVAEAAAEDLVRTYKNVYLFGHSMGGGIALITAAEVEGIKKVAVAAPAVYAGEKLPISPKLALAISVLLKRFPHKWKTNPEYHMHYEGAPKDDLYLGHEYWSWVYVRQILELHMLMRRAADSLKNIKIPTKVLVLENDSILPNPDYYRFIRDNIKASLEIKEIKGATHYVFYDKNQRAEEEAVNEVLSFIP